MQAPQFESLVGHYVGRYRITRKIGEGRVGGVYEVVQQNIGHRAVMKVLRPELAGDPKHQKFVERLVDEARAVNLINHPGVVRVFDLAEMPGNSVYIMMEYLEGCELSAYLRNAAQGTMPQLTVAQTMGIVKQLASVLAVAHDKGILHRDIKPQDVFLTPDSNYSGGFRVRLLDFGVALFLGTEDRRTTAGIALGTPYYMSPEQCLGDDDIESRTDVYSLGAVAYEMLSGGPPFRGELRDVMRQHVRDAPRPVGEVVAGLPPVVATLVMQMLAKKKDERPNMREVEARIADMEKKGELAASSAAPVPAKPEPSSSRRPSPAWLGGVAAGALLLGVLLGSLLHKPAAPVVPTCPAVVCPPSPPPGPPPKPESAVGPGDSGAERPAEPPAKNKAGSKAKGKGRPPA